MKETVAPSDKCVSLAGQVFGSWTVLAHVAGAEHAEARCACGAIKAVSAWDLRRGSTRRCAGCRRAAADAKRPQPGQKFGSWQVIGPSAKGSEHVLCRCDCGQEKDVYRYDLPTGKSTKCKACYRVERARRQIRHGQTVGRWSTTYRCWMNMRTRCSNPRATSWKHYGGRGIRVCERWETFENFLADMGERPAPHYWIERYDVDAGYCPENCGWEPKEVQPHNKTNTVWVEVDGVRMSLTKACELLGLNWKTAVSRRKRGLSGSQLIAPAKPAAEVGFLAGKARHGLTPQPGEACLSALAGSAGINRATVNGRKLRGWPEELWTKPVGFKYVQPAQYLYEGEFLPIKEICQREGRTASTIKRRIKQGLYPPESDAQQAWLGEVH